MQITNDDSELALLLPQRAGLPLPKYLSLTFPEDADDLLLPALEDLHLQPGQSALLYSAEEQDDGTLCHVRGWDTDDLMLEPGTLSLGTPPTYQRAVIFLLARPNLLGFFADWKYFHGGAHYFQRPQRVFRRKSRTHSRVRIHGNVQVRRRSGAVTSHALHDFSPSGASFYSEEANLAQGEMLLIEMEINACGVCETTATVARVESLEHAAHGYLVGIRFNLTAQQKNRAEQLYLCQRGEVLQQMNDTARHRWAPPKTP